MYNIYKKHCSKSYKIPATQIYYSLKDVIDKI